MIAVSMDGHGHAVGQLRAERSQNKPKSTGYTYSHAETFARYRDELVKKLNAIKAELGDQLICHPNYKANPLHSLQPEIYLAAGAAYREAIAAAAQAIREMNPEWRRAQAVIKAATGTY